MHSLRTLICLTLAASIGPAACGGSTSTSESGGAAGEASAGQAGLVPGGAPAANIGGADATDASVGDDAPNVPIDHLPCPPEQWTCQYSPCFGWPTPSFSCRCDPSAPTTAADCAPDEDFTCAEATVDSTSTPIGRVVRWACRCEPRADGCCNHHRWHDLDSYNGEPVSGCDDSPGPREVVCGCSAN